MYYEEVSDYVERLVGDGGELLAWVSRRSDELREFGVLRIDPSRGRLLELIARLRSPKRVLEVGSGAGYSALWFLKGMPADGILDAIEHNPKAARALEATIRKAGVENRVRIHQGRALDVLLGLEGPYEVVFIDADKDEYPNYFEQVFRLTRPGAVILADNMLWHGSTVQGKDRKGARGIVEYTKRIFSHPEFSSLILPLGDGLALSYRTK